MLKSLRILVPVIVLASLLLSACGPAKVVTQVVEKVVTQEVVKEGKTIVETVVSTVVVEVTPVKPKELVIFNWWTGPGEKEAADAMYKAFADAYPDVTVVQNPVPGGGGVNQRTVLQARLTAGLPPDTFQTLGGAEMKNYVDSGVLQPLDDLYTELDYANKIPGPLLKAVSVDGTPTLSR